jgi:site-specific recombinase XerD
MPLESSLATAHLTPQTPLVPAIHSWEIYLRDQGRSLYTIKAFIGDLHLLSSFLPPDRTVGAVGTVDLNHFLTWLQKGRGISCSPKSLARRITSIKAFFRWLQRSGVLLNDPAVKVIQQSVMSPLPVILTSDEVLKVVEAASALRTAKKADARPYTLAALILETGIKKGECLALTRNHVDLDTPDGPVLFVRYASPSSRYKERKIQLSVDWIQVYQEYLAQYAPPDHIFPWSPRRLEYLLEDLGNSAGLDKHLSFDMCRWTCALDDWKSGIEHEKIRQKLGVSKIQWREVSLKLRQLAEEKVG